MVVKALAAVVGAAVITGRRVSTLTAQAPLVSPMTAIVAILVGRPPIAMVRMLGLCWKRELVKLVQVEALVPSVSCWDIS